MTDTERARMIVHPCGHTEAQHFHYPQDLQLSLKDCPVAAAECKELEDFAGSIGIRFDADLAEEGSGWEVPMEPEPRYFATLPEAIRAHFDMLNKVCDGAERDLKAAQEEIAELKRTR